MILTGEVGGIARTENTYWPKELAKLGLEGFKAYDTEHGFTTVILPTGYGIIVKYHDAEGVVEKCTPSLLAYCMFSQAAKKMQKQGEPLLCMDGEYRDRGWIGIRDMHSEQRRLTLEVCHQDLKARYGERWEEVGEIDTLWVAHHINERPELLAGFKF